VSYSTVSSLNFVLLYSFGTHLRPETQSLVDKLGAPIMLYTNGSKMDEKVAAGYCQVSVKRRYIWAMSQEATSSDLKQIGKLDWYAMYNTQVEYKTLRKGKRRKEVCL
jgi:hypothetical protein